MNKVMYEKLGISCAVAEFSEKILEKLKPRFDEIDKIAEYNQAKVTLAMQKKRVCAECFAGSTGYGYNDRGRETLEEVYAECFNTEAALVRPQITCGTHALAIALSANLLPGDELLSPVGRPYDTLEEVIGIRESTCSLREYGVSYSQVDLLPDGTFDYENIKKAINEKEFLDKINIKRFSKELRINNRPATLNDLNVLLQKRKNVTLIDLTDPSSRMYLSALYAITFKDIDIKDIFNAEKVFQNDSKEDTICSEAASEFINIIYNGNGIEICDILVKMAEVFSSMEMPSLQEGKLGDIFNNYTLIYAAAALAHRFDKAFSRHEHLKQAMRRQMIDRFWGVYCNILLYKKYGDIVSFCHSVANIDLKKYRDDRDYENSIVRSFEAAERAVRDINEERKTL